jgi:glucan phosphoethanolaminetransferase (alkaline phosphatase superfamily)
MTTKLRTFLSNFRNEVQTHRGTWLAILFAITLLTLPNLFAVGIPSFNWLGVKLFGFGALLVLAACAAGFRVRVILWLCAPLLLLGPASCAYLIGTGTLPSSFLLLALLETNRTELSIFVIPAALTLVCTAALVVVYLWYVRRMIPHGYRLALGGRVVVGLGLFVPSGLDLLSNGLDGCKVAMSQRLLTTFPTATFFSAYEAAQLRAECTGRMDVTDKLEVGQAAEHSDPSTQQVHMLVIGESARYASFGLNGYERDTTPLLQRTASGLVAFHDVCSTAPMTLAAVPQLLTPATIGKLRETTKLPSVMTAYRKAGYKVYWVSSQRRNGTFDTLTSIFSNDAHESFFLGGAFDAEGVGGYSGTQDIKLLPQVEKILARKEPRVLFVLHTMGSHAPYFTRYPRKQTRFPVDSDAAWEATKRITLNTSTDPEDLRLLTDAYDNSICATDHLLANLIYVLKTSGASSWFCYLSDHGENGADAPVGKFMHGTLTPDVLHVPMFMWASPAYEHAHPSVMAALRSHTETPFSAICTFHTLLDMGGLSCTYLKKDWSVASSSFNPGPRLVAKGAITPVDYDKEILPNFLKRNGWHPLHPKTPAAAAAR